MKAKINRLRCSAILILASLFLAGSLVDGLALDAFTFSYHLTDGGYTLELTPNYPFKGVEFSVNSASTQFELLQDIVVPLRSRDNPALALSSPHFVVRRLTGSSGTGSFYVQSNDVPVSGVQRLYTSASNGGSVSFTLVYGIASVESIPEGHYYGKVGLTMRPINAARDQVVQYLDIYVTVSRETGAKPAVELKVPTGGKTIVLERNRREARTGEIEAAVSGQFARKTSIQQQLLEPLRALESAAVMPPESIICTALDVERGSVPAAQPLALRPLEAYVSEADGRADDAFLLQYALDESAVFAAGTYRSRIQYYLDEMGKRTNLDIFDLEVRVERVFDLFVKPLDPTGKIMFRQDRTNPDVADESLPQKEVLLEVKSNIFRQYQVNQNVESDLTIAGEVLPVKHLRVSTEPVHTKGDLKISAPVEVTKGTQTLFVSDAKGSADSFKVVYQLDIPRTLNVKSGEYSARITYSLVEL